MYFQSQVDQTKVVFDNQGKNALQCIMFSLEKSQFIYVAYSHPGAESA